jgi:hypothetical protein
LRESVGIGAVGEQDVRMGQEPIDGGRSQGLGHELVKAGRVDVAREGDRAFLVGGVDDTESASAASGATASIPMSSITMRSARINRPIASATVSSGAVAPEQQRERLQRVPGDRASLVDDEVPERFR